MANYCNNWISFEGKKNSLDKLVKKLKTYDKSKYFTEWCEYVIGKGKLDGGEGFQKKYGTDFNVYYMYGTKWFDFNIEGEGTHLRVYGDSAWSPPIKFVEEVCKKFQLKAEMEYEECGNDFAGRTTFDETGILKEEDYTYDEWRYRESHESWYDDVYYRFADDLENAKDELEWCLENMPYAKEGEIQKIYDNAIKESENVL